MPPKLIPGIWSNFLFSLKTTWSNSKGKSYWEVELFSPHFLSWITFQSPLNDCTVPEFIDFNLYSTIKLISWITFDSRTSGSDVKQLDMEREEFDRVTVGIGYRVVTSDDQSSNVTSGQFVFVWFAWCNTHISHLPTDSTMINWYARKKAKVEQRKRIKQRFLPHKKQKLVMKKADHVFALMTKTGFN